MMVQRPARQPTSQPLADVTPGPTGAANEQTPSFWDAVLKPRPRSGEKAASNVLGWLAALGQPGVAASASSAPDAKRKHEVDSSEDEQPDQAASQDPSTPADSASGQRAVTGRPHDRASETPHTTISGKTTRAARTDAHGQPHTRQTGGGTGAAAAAAGSTAAASAPCAEAPGEARGVASLSPPSVPTSAPSPTSPSTPGLSPCLNCLECEMPIVGAIFMLHDQAFCCQRHRLNAYHKAEKAGQSAGSAPSLNATNTTLVTTGLRASYATWM